MMLLAAGLSTPAARAAEPGGVQVAREGLVIEAVGQYGRRPFHTDAIEELLVRGTWSAPRAGDTLSLPDGTFRTWTAVSANEQGWFEHAALRGGYLVVSVDAPADCIMLLDASGHRHVTVHGTLRAGDPYEAGIVRLPVKLRAGKNHLLFRGARGRVRCRLEPPPAEQFLDPGDHTLPDLLVGEPLNVLGSVRVVNAADHWVTGLRLIAAAGTDVRNSTPIKPLPPRSVTKVPFTLSADQPVDASAEPLEMHLTLDAGSGSGKPAGESLRLTPAVRRHDQRHQRTFRSAIDDSVQYYAVRPATAARPQALLLTLHGAGVEARGQVDAYAPKDWIHIVGPTNRRPYGFDWEDWGRLDALEVLDHARRVLQPDPSRVYLSGHSMGGHGCYHLAATFPDRFAAVGPSAGWISFWSYGAAALEQDSAVGRILSRSVAGSDTAGLIRNLKNVPMYLLHGDADDNVPVTQARTMRAMLDDIAAQYAYHEQPGAGHWWDNSDSPGAACVDWPAMFEFFSRQRLPRSEQVRTFEFVTVNPAVSSSCHWITVEAQQHALQPSRVVAAYDPEGASISLTTENVSRLVLDAVAMGSPGEIAVELDGTHFPPRPVKRPWRFRKLGDTWGRLSGPLPDGLKGPRRYGPFKEVFRHRVLLVYGTAGDESENRWALDKARYDAETFWYRGNGTLEILPDSEFEARAAWDRNVVLYGNADTNRAWSALLGGSPVQVRRHRLQVGRRHWQGDDLGALFIYPRRGSAHALVGVVGGTGLTGMRLTERLPYFVSGIGYPDWIVFGPEILRSATAGVRAAGFFSEDWRLEDSDSAYQPVEGSRAPAGAEPP